MRLFKKMLWWFAGHRSYKWVVQDWIKIADLDACGRVLLTERFRVNLLPILRKSPAKNQKVLVLSPHQDDETIGAGGTLLLAARSGANVTCVYVTDGSLASPSVPPKEMAEVREQEARRVWKVIGGQIIFWHYPDGGIPLDEIAAKKLADTVKENNPDVIFIPFFLEDHPDHRRVNHLLWLARGIGLPKRIEIWAYQVWSGLIPNIAVDITEVMEKS